MNVIARIGNYALSRIHARGVIAHKRAMAAPMIGAQMVNDPFIRTMATGAASLRERRFCQYAAAISRQSGAMPANQAAFAAVFDQSAGAVHFLTTGPNPRVYATFSIPKRILEFNPDDSTFLLDAPEDRGAGQYGFEAVAAELGLVEEWR